MQQQSKQRDQQQARDKATTCKALKVTGPMWKSLKA